MPGQQETTPSKVADLRATAPAFTPKLNAGANVFQPGSRPSPGAIAPWQMHQGSPMAFPAVAAAQHYRGSPLQQHTPRVMPPQPAYHYPPQPMFYPSPPMVMMPSPTRHQFQPHPHMQQPSMLKPMRAPDVAMAPRPTPPATIPVEFVQEDLVNVAPAPIAPAVVSAPPAVVAVVDEQEDAIVEAVQAIDIAAVDEASIEAVEAPIDAEETPTEPAAVPIESEEPAGETVEAEATETDAVASDDKLVEAAAPVEAVVAVLDDEPANVDAEKSEEEDGAVLDDEDDAEVEKPPPPAVDDAAIPADPQRYTLDALMELKAADQCNRRPKFADASLDCIRRTPSSMPPQHAGGRYEGRSSSFSDRRSSRDQQPAPGRKSSFVPARSASRNRNRSPSRDFSRNQFGNLQGTSKPQHGQDSKRRGSHYQMAPVLAPVNPLTFSENRYVIKEREGQEKVLRNVQSILNKLTPEKFDKLIDSLVDLIIEHVVYLDDVIALVFEKAVNEYSFVNTYADLCLHLSKRFVESKNDEAGKFRAIILNICKAEFESRPNKETFAAIADADEREEAIRLSRRRARGLMTFIGQLFNRGLLHWSVMTTCVVKLAGNLESPAEFDLEDLATILTVVGKKFDAGQHVPLFNTLFAHIKSWAEQKLASSRIIFLLKDLVDLRSSRWAPRREVVVASTIAEVHKKAAREAADKERASQKSHERERRGSTFQRRDSRAVEPPSRMQRSSSGSQSLANRRGSQPATVVNAGGWNVVGSSGKPSGSMPSAQSMDASKSTTSAETESAVGPSESAAVQPSASSAPISARSESINAFGILGNADDEDDVEIMSEMSVCDRSDSDSHDEAEDPEEIRKQIRRFVKEFLQIANFEELELSLDELSQTGSDFIVSEAFIIASEGSVKHRELIVDLVAHAHKLQHLTVDNIIVGIKECVDVLDDLVIDSPLIKQHMNEFTAKLITRHTLGMYSLRSELPDLAAEVVSSLLDQRGMEFLLDLARENKLKLESGDGAPALSTVKEGQASSASDVLRHFGLDHLIDCL